MKFLLAADNFSRGSGGAPRSAQDIVKILLAAGHQVAVIEEGKKSLKTDAADFDHYQIRLRGPLLPGDRDLVTIILNPRWRKTIRSLAISFGPDLIITQGMLAPGALQAGAELGIPTAYFFRGYGPFCPIQYNSKCPETDCTRPQCWGCLSPSRKFKYPLLKKVLKLYESTVPDAALIVANSKYIAGIFDRFWNTRTEVVLPTVGLLPAEKPENDPSGYLLFIKPQKIKGLDILLELARRMPEQEFAVAGETRGKAARTLANLKNVKILGWRDDIGEVYRGAKALLGPSLWPEPFGRVFAEAAAVGCPSIAFNSGGIPEAAGKCAKLLPRGASIDDWIAAVNSLNDSAAYEEMRQASLSHALELASSCQSAHLLELLEKTAKTNPDRPAGNTRNRKKLKVAHIISALSRGGAELVLFQLATRTDRQKFDVEVICLREEGQLADDFRQAGIPVMLHKLKSRCSPLGLWSLARYLKRNKIDIVHTHLRRPNTSGRIAAALAGIPVVIAHEHNPGPEKSRRHFMIDRLLARFSNTIIAVSSQTASRNSQLSGIAPEKFTVIPNAVDLERFNPETQGFSRQELGIQAEAFVLGFVGRLHSVKNLDVLIRGAAQTIDELPELHLLLVGDGPQRQKLEALTEEVGMQERTTFLGMRDDLEKIYPLMDCLGLISKSEGFSLVILEGAACGLPLIVTPVGWVLDFAKNEQEALIVPIGDQEALASAILLLARDPQLRTRLGHQARKKSESMGMDSFVKKIENLYSKHFLGFG
jgi:glycosyltransferase involved in cell wall biosynthesis